MTNSACLARRFTRFQRRGQHDHAHLINYGVGPCQGHTGEFYDGTYHAVKEEFLKQIASDICNLVSKVLNIVNSHFNDTQMLFHPHDEFEGHKQLHHGMEYYDDVYGKPLEKNMAIQARKLEMQFVKKKQVHSKFDRAEAKGIGAKIITTRWIDTNKGDEINRDCPSRFASSEIQTNNGFDLFVATPPLESLRVILSICQSNLYACGPYRILSSDMERYYFFAKAKRPVSIEIPIEDQESRDEHKVGRLNLSL